MREVGLAAITKRDRVRLENLLARTAREVGRLKLHRDRIADLLSALDHEHRQLGSIEQQDALALAQSVAEALSGLTEREQRILRMRFGIGGTAEHTLEEVGKIFGVPGSASGRSKHQPLGSCVSPPAGASS